jgi:hypothetical protein
MADEDQLGLQHVRSKRRFQGNEMSETKRTKNIAFRVTDDDYARIESVAAAAGDEPNNWCRKLTISKLVEGHSFTTNERLIYQEVALLRFLVGHGFKQLFGGDESAAAKWKKLTAQADQRSEEITQELLSRRR